jgi:hypothetical protein
MEALERTARLLWLSPRQVAGIREKMLRGHAAHGGDCWRQDFDWRREAVDELRDIVGYLAIAVARGRRDICWHRVRAGLDLLWRALAPGEVGGHEGTTG